jgi:cytochrome c biogenesis protein
MELAIVLLVLLAVCALLGTLLPQLDVVAEADIQRRFGDWYFVAKALGLFSLFSSNWFLALEGVFFCSLLFGSLRWLHPAWRSVTLRTFLSPQHIEACRQQLPPLTFPASQPLASVRSRVTAAVKAAGFQVHSAPDGQPFLYAHKGDWGRIGPMVVHAGLLSMLLASLLGAFTNFTAQVMARPDQPFSVDKGEVFRTSVSAPFWLGRVPPWQAKMTGFAIEFYPDHPTVAMQYTTQLAILPANGKGPPLATGQVSVNHPFQYDGVTFYQASYAPTGKLNLIVDGQPVALATNGEQLASRPVGRYRLNSKDSLLMFPFFRQQDGVRENHLQVFTQQNGRIAGLPNRPVLASSTMGTPDGKADSMPSVYVPEGDQAGAVIQGRRIIYHGPEYASGLQIKSAPEVGWMYGSFLLVAIGMVMSLIPQRQLWLAVRPLPDGSYTMLGYWKTRKTKHRYQQDLARLYETLT